MTLTTGTATSFITFSRASTATRINASGLVESVASGAARIDYDPVTLAAKGLLVEEQRTNYLLYSEQPNNAYWFSIAGSFTVNATTAPDGNATADKFVLNSGLTEHYIQSTAVTATSGTTYTFSCYLKAAELSSVTLSFRVGSVWASGAVQGVTFELSNGTASVAYGTPAYSITPCGNGWYRCSIICTAAASGSPSVRISSGVSADGQGFYLWGMQYEAGAFATSYIPTTAASVTRSADVASVPTSSFPYNATGSSLIVAFSSFGTGGNGATAWFSDGALNNRWGASVYYGTAHRTLSLTGGTVQADIITGTYINNTVYKQAVGFASNSLQMAVNGALGTEDTSVSVPSVTRLDIGSVANVGQLNGHIRQVTYIPRRLTNAELQARTA